MFNWTHSALCVVTVHSLAAIYPKISGKCISVAQVYSVLFPADATTCVTLSAKKQEAGNGFQRTTVKLCCFSSLSLSLYLQGWEVIQGHLADLLNQHTTHHDQSVTHWHLPRWATRPSLSLPVLNLSSLTWLLSYFQNTPSESLLCRFTPANSSILCHRGLVCTLNTLMIMLLCLLLCETASLSPAALLLSCACCAKPNGSKNKKPKQGRHHQRASL